MDRLVPIQNVQQRLGNREINNAIASNLLPVTFQPAINNPQGNQNFVNQMFNQNIPQNNQGTLPISITTAQRQANNPYQDFSRMTHESRFGQIMYQNGASKSKTKKIFNTSKPSPGLLVCLLPGILTLILFIFVISCIVKHNKHPLSTNSLRYYLEHPDQITDSRLQAAILFARMNYNGVQNIESQNFGSFDPNNFQLSSFETNRSELPVGSGSCRQGLHYFNGLCYPCKVGYWNGIKCTTQPRKQVNQSTTITQKQTKPIIKTNNNQITLKQLKQKSRLEKLHRYNINFINNLNSQSNTVNQSGNTSVVCKQNQFLLNGKCVTCPQGMVWNGKNCERIHHHLKSYN